jgi:hypothetical protein
MLPTSQASRVADEIIDANRRDRAWRSSFLHPLPTWFKGPHLAGLSEHERRERFDELSRRVLGRPSWVLGALATAGGIIAVGVFVVQLPVAVLAIWPATAVALWRHGALRREFKRDAQAYAASAADAAATRDRP